MSKEERFKFQCELSLKVNNATERVIPKKTAPQAIAANGKFLI